MAKTKLGKKYPNSETIMLRDYLAIDRTRLANQRTLLSFLRTALYLIISALAVVKVDFLRGLAPWSWVGLALAVSVFLVGVLNYYLVNRRVKAAYDWHDSQTEGETHK